MTNNTFIDKNRQLSLAQDFEYLREEGMSYIESLAHKLWTDYNAHDPGITILEVLCYAITELGYRNGFDMATLLSNSEGVIKNETFFPAKQILTNAPLTKLDYRKLLIDISGVNNAWLMTHKDTYNDHSYKEPLDSEVALYVNPKEDKLSLKDKDIFGNPLNRLPIRGLNQVILDLSEDLELGQLNEISLDYSWTDDQHLIQVDVLTDYNSWNQNETIRFAHMNSKTKIKFKEQPKKNKNRIELIIESRSDASKTLRLYVLTRDLRMHDAIITHFNDLSNVASIIDMFDQKRKRVMNVLEDVSEILNDNRNLTEDWLCHDTIEVLNVGVCADVDIETSADAEAILAKIEMTVDLLLNPSIRFYTLKQMLDLGKTAREIFSGPSLHHGFLQDDEVIDAQLPDCIHVSDIISALVDIEGIKSVNNVLISAYDRLGDPIPSMSSEQWCLKLNGKVKPVFDAGRSKLLLFRDGIPFIIPPKGKYELVEGLEYLKIENDTYKLQDPKDDFDFPQGNHLQIDNYYSIQNDFPMTYRIGRGEMRDSETNERKAQAKQLKAYLLHFDQLIADFFKQLYHAKDLFALNQINSGLEIDKTYYQAYLKNISGIDSESFWEEIYVDEYKDQIVSDPNEIKRSQYEDDNLFYDRRNRFLDHLISRFSESFNDYVFMMFTMQQNAAGAAELVLQKDELISDKQKFVENYPELSYKRGLGYNYQQEKNDELPWKIASRGGFAKRIAALLGINNFELADIIDNNSATTWSYETDIGSLEFSLTNSLSIPLEEKWELAQMLINNVSAYKVVSFARNSFIFFVNEDNKRIVKLNKEFSTALEAQEFIPKLYQALNSYFENFYCIEHLLLRPLTQDVLTDDDLLNVCLNDDCYSEANNDPYSFKVTVVLPGWLGRFRNRYFRRYAENLIRNEAPAYVLVKICWVGREDMRNFQKSYKKWLTEFCSFRKAYCSKSQDKGLITSYHNSLAQLVKDLKELNTIYDEGTLHDCIESELDNPISLNNSSLGTLKNIEP